MWLIQMRKCSHLDLIPSGFQAFSSHLTPLYRQRFKAFSMFTCAIFTQNQQTVDNNCSNSNSRKTSWAQVLHSYNCYCTVLHLGKPFFSIGFYTWKLPCCAHSFPMKRSVWQYTEDFAVNRVNCFKIATKALKRILFLEQALKCVSGFH